MAYTEFGIKVRVKMLRLGITQRELAQELGISPGYLSEILKGIKPGELYKDRILKYLGMEEA